jgi:hypothetical protein
MDMTCKALIGDDGVNTRREYDTQNKHFRQQEKSCIGMCDIGI